MKWRRVRIEFPPGPDPDQSPDFEKHWAIPLSAYVEVDSSLIVSERISCVRCRKLRNYSIIPFLLSLSAYSELTEIKMFTGINLAQSLHMCKHACVISIGLPSWFKNRNISNIAT